MKQIKLAYAGLCLGGPMDGEKMKRLDPVYDLAKLKGPLTYEHPADEPIDYCEDFKRGRYEYASGIWWWRGWER